MIIRLINLYSKVLLRCKIEKSEIDVLDNAQFEIFFKDIASAMPLQERVSAETLKKLIKKELEVSGVKTKFEFVIFNSGVTTKIKSGDFKYNKEATYSIPVLQIMKEMKMKKNY
jgi:two-component system phosphate regulon sensor histidine kinase PhoR